MAYVTEHATELADYIPSKEKIRLPQYVMVNIHTHGKGNHATEDRTGPLSWMRADDGAMTLAVNISDLDGQLLTGFTQSRDNLEEERCSEMAVRWLRERGYKHVMGDNGIWTKEKEPHKLNWPSLGITVGSILVLGICAITFIAIANAGIP